ncbi:MAG: hypothetical protein NXI20_03270 [bacterium]|nr:hypothetical protein [bacterium]
MSTWNNLRPVLVQYKGKKSKGYFHRFVYSHSRDFSETKALIELEDGKLRTYDLYFIQFTDRKNDSNPSNE